MSTESYVLSQNFNSLLCKVHVRKFQRQDGCLRVKNSPTFSRIVFCFKTMGNCEQGINFLMRKNVNVSLKLSR